MLINILVIQTQNLHTREHNTEMFYRVYNEGF